MSTLEVLALLFYAENNVKENSIKINGTEINSLRYMRTIQFQAENPNSWWIECEISEKFCYY